MLLIPPLHRQPQVFVGLGQKSCGEFNWVKDCAATRESAACSVLTILKLAIPGLSSIRKALRGGGGGGGVRESHRA